MNGQNHGDAFTPGVLLTVIPSERSSVVATVGPNAALHVVALRMSGGGLDYLVFHESMSQPQWIGPGDVTRVQTPG